MENILAEHYCIKEVEVSAVQGGFCADAFKITTANKSYFLKRYDKNRPITEKCTKLIDSYTPILQYFSKSTMADYVPKFILTIDGKVLCEDNHYIYMLYEYIDGITIADRKLTKAQVKELGKIVGMLHSSLSEKCTIPKSMYEDFSIDFNDKLHNFIQSNISNYSFLDPYISNLKKLTIQTAEQSEKAKLCNAPFVLCHTDIHNWNLMQTKDNLILIDWEGIKYAPKEADFFALTDIPYREEFISEYKNYNEQYEINQTILDFYDVRRKSEDIWEFIEKLVHENLTPKERIQTINDIIEECSTISDLL